MTTATRVAAEDAFNAGRLAQDTDLDRLVLDAITAGVPDVDVTSCITEATVEHAMTGAGILTLELDDNERRILRSGVLAHAIRVSLDDDHYRLRAVDKRDNGLTLTLEEEVVALLRRHNKPRVAYRDTVSRALFAQTLVREVRARPIRFVTAAAKSLRLSVGHDEPARRSSPSKPANGFDKGVTLKVQGVKADGEQLRNAARALRIADKLNAGDKATLALLLAIITENGLRNTQGKGDDRVSWGIFQCIPGTSAGTRNVADALNIERCATTFLKGPGFTGRGGAIALARKNPGWSAGNIAAEIEGPLARYRGRYDEHAAEGRAMLAAWRGGSSSSADTDTAGTKRYAFRRGELHGKKEDSWTCLNRLADEVRWRCFAYRGAVWFISDADLLREPAVCTLTEDTEGVRGIDFQIDGGKVTGNVTLTVDVGRYALRPGMVVALRDCGPADGRWLVENVRRSLFSTDATVTLRRAQKPLPEPPAEKTGSSSGHTSGTGSGSGASGGTKSKVGEVKLTSAWGGSQSIIDSFVTPFMRRKGLSPGNAKRTPSQNAAAGGSATSDHLTTLSGSYATDYPTTSGEAAARALSRELGYTAWQPNSYATARIVVGGHTFQVQILWGAGIEHGDHVHVGVKRIS